MVKWRRSGQRSGDLIDRRGSRGSPALGGGIPVSLGSLSKMGIPGLVILGVILAFTMCSGGNSLGQTGLSPLDQAPAADPVPRQQDPDAELVDFLSFILDDIQAEWSDLFRFSEREYGRAELVVFEGYTQSSCGGAAEQIGPHYCPLDERVYLDLDFFRDLATRYGAEGDFAIAYVLAHEIGHHVQQELGISAAVRQQQHANPDRANELSVALELQADCFAGVWGYTTFDRNLLETGDLQEALEAAAAVGDDRLQGQAGTRVNPESWTHGSSEQRMEWFRRGFGSGDPEICDTF